MNPTPDTQLDFLSQVLKAIAESNGDAGVIHPLLEAHVDKLDISFAQVLRNWATGTLPDLETETVQSIAGVIVNFSTRMWDFPLGNRADNLEIAITGYEIALTVFTRESFLIEWATTQNNLGIAYSNRIRGERAENLEIAIQCYTNALQERTRARFPIQWATTQNNLGAAYWERIRGERAENLEIAIQYYTNALQERTRARFPIQWATTQNNLGIAYSDRIRGERAENLELAISCYTQALQEYTRDRFPIDWAMTQNNLGLAYGDRIRGERAENLEIAIECYTNALQVRTRARFPIDWATTQNNLGNAYSNRIRGERAENLELAIQCYTQALQVRTCDALPQNHAETAFNLGLAYIDAERFADAYNIFQSAIDTVEFLRGEIVSGDEVKQKHAEEYNRIYRRMVEVCLELEYYDQAVEYIERSKTRNLVELIASQKPFQPLHELDQKIAEELEHIRFAEIQALVDDGTAIVRKDSGGRVLTKGTLEVEYRNYEQKPASTTR